MKSGAELYREAFFIGLKPDPLLTVSEWADDNRFLSQKSSSEPGRWRTERTPYLRTIMDCLSPSSTVQKVVFQAGAQIGKTETGNNWFGYVVHHCPGPMLMVQPTVDMAKRLSKQRLAPMIEESPVLRERIAESRARDSGNTMLAKEFRGGFLIITGANSAVGLRSMPVRFLFLDEIDAYPSDVDGEGDPVKLAERRTTTFLRKKIYMVSTPTIKDISRIEKEYLASDRRRFYVPCPHCQNMDWIRWANIKWDNEDPKTAKLLCDKCGCLIDEYHKTQMLNKGEWRAEFPGDGRAAGFHLSSLYSPLGWKSWKEIVEEFLEAKNDPPRLKEWVNTVLAETWEEQYSAGIEADALAKFAENYPLLTVPYGGLILTAGVDVQDNRIEVKIKAWGRGEESWLVNHVQIFGDPTENELWKQVDSVIFQDYKHESGIKMKVTAGAVDTGYHTHHAYAYCRERKKSNIIAIKGSSVAGKPALSKPSKQDVNFKNQTIKKGVELWTIGTGTIKSIIYSRLKKAGQKGDGCYHFPLGLPDEYYKQLTAEKQITKGYVNGFPKRVWVKKDGARNEALDCEVYAYAALQFVYTRLNRSTVWDQFEKKWGINKKQEELKNNEDVKVNQPDDPPNLTKKPRRRPKKTGFVKNW
jgi:phage terminase large subunit GpA-like protein